MALSDGDAARNGDTWLRIATHKDHIKNGRAQHGAFSGSAISEPETQRPWERELSGRLRSLAGTTDDVIAHGVATCAELTAKYKQTKTFAGVMYAPVEDLRLTYKDTIKSEVFYTPVDPTDLAHADLTFTPYPIATRPELEEFTLWLSDQLKALHHPERGQSQMEHLPPAADVRTGKEKFLDLGKSLIGKK